MPRLSKVGRLLRPRNPATRRLSLSLVDAVSQFARGKYAAAADTLKSLSADQRISVGGSYVERMLINLVEARAVELAA